jgi:thermostable 8-oxoguanine DNA glycosylase
MSQQGCVFLDRTILRIELPSPNSELMHNLTWGMMDSFLTPAYWAYQVFAKRLEGKSINYRLGNSLKEEVGACLLGGHGIPAQIGLAAYEYVKQQGAFSGGAPSEEEFLNWLKQPMVIEGRFLHYRFAKQKARYLAAAMLKLDSESPPISSGQEFRNWLLNIPGVGLKTASWIARNWLDADDVAILDIHILRAGVLGGFFAKHLTVERNYLELEKQFIEFSRALQVRPSELDAVIWLEMMSSPKTVHQLLGAEDDVKNSKGRRATKNRHTNPNQSSLII